MRLVALSPNLFCVKSLDNGLVEVTDVAIAILNTNNQVANNPDLILAIQSAGVSRGRNGFRKDKSGEKLAESEEDLLEHRTDGPDGFDTLYIGCEKFPVRDTVSVPVSGIL